MRCHNATRFSTSLAFSVHSSADARFGGTRRPPGPGPQAKAALLCGGCGDVGLVGGGESVTRAQLCIACGAYGVGGVDTWRGER